MYLLRYCAITYPVDPKRTNKAIKFRFTAANYDPLFKKVLKVALHERELKGASISR